MSFANISSESVACSLILLLLIFAGAEVFNLNKVQLIISFLDQVFRVSKKLVATLQLI